MTTRALALVHLTLACAIAPVAAQAPFRSAVNSVVIAVSVRQSGRAVPDLRLQDFRVTDAGHPQVPLDLTYERLPTDLTFLVDLSGSMSALLVETLSAGVKQVRSGLTPDDRVGVITFNHRVRELLPLSPAAGPVPESFGRADGNTSLVDALTVALLTRPEPGRRRMIMVFSDGRDTSSFTEGEAVIDVAGRRDTAVFLVALRNGGNDADLRRGGLFPRLASVSGGQAIVIKSRDEIGRSFLKAVEEFRSSYVLRYTYQGPDVPGWHSLDVDVLAKGSFDVRAREGYYMP